MVRILTAAALASAMLVATAAHAQGDSGKGHAIFHEKCSVCHLAGASGPKLLGAPLFGVVGRGAGTVPGYAYSPAMKASGLVWTNETLEHYLADPAKVVPGTHMTFAGLKNDAAIDDVVAYLDTLK
jgi:cytochrome c